MEFTELVLTLGLRISVAVVAVSAVIMFVTQLFFGNAFTITCLSVLAIFSVLALIEGWREDKSKARKEDGKC